MFTIKKLFCLALSVCLLVGLSACGKEGQNEMPIETQVLRGYVVEQGSEGERGLDEYCFILSMDDLSLYYVDFARKCSLPNNSYVEVKYNGWVQPSDPPIIVGEEITKDEITLLSMYANMLDELMEKDGELGREDRLLSLDISENTGLSKNEIAILGVILSKRYGFEEVLLMSYEELKENGYIKGLEEDMDSLPYFEDGLLISINSEKGYKENGFTFDASKYKGGLAAYFFENCKAKKQGNEWLYTVGSEAIS